MIELAMKFRKKMLLTTLICVSNPIWGQVKILDPLLSESVRLECHADSCFINGDINSAKDVYSKIVELWDNRKIHNERYAKNLYNLSRCLSKTGNYSEALALGKEALEIQKKILGKEHSDVIASLNNLVENYAELGDYPEAIKIGNDALSVAKKMYGNNHLDYATTLNTLAWPYYCTGNNVEAIKLVSEALKIRKRVLGSNHPDYATSLSNLALYKYELGSLSEAINLELEAKEIRQKSLGNEHKDYAISLDNLASYYSYIGNYTEALKLCSEALKIRKIVLGDKHDEFAISLHNLATINGYLGNYTEAVRLETEAVNILRQKKDNTISYYAITNVLCTFHNILGNYEESLSLSKELLKSISENIGCENSQYATTLENLAKSYFKLGERNKTVDFVSEAINIRKKIQGENHPDYAYSLYTLACYYFDMGKYNESIKLVNKALNVIKKCYGDNSIDYAKLLICLAKNHFALSNYIKASKELINSIDIKSSNLISNFSHLSSFRRRHLWEIEKSFYLVDVPKLTYYLQESNLISSLYDNSALLAKGILLNTEIEMKTLIDESGNPELKSIYQTLLSNREIYDKQSNISIEDRCVDVDSLKQTIQNQEDELVKKSKPYGDYMHNLRITWQDIQRRLNDKELAIEFLDFPVSEDSTMYVALTLKKGYSNPRMIPLFELSQLKSINQNDFFRTSRLAKLVWGPLEDELKDVKSVFFSPSGELHKIGIEYLPLSADKYIFDQFKLIRLSSTRQLVTSRSEDIKKQAVIYGGINYDAPLYASSLSEENNSTVYVDSLTIRGGREYLKGTRIEADNISTRLKQKKWICTYYTGNKGTEDSFKMLSGNSPSILHIATHGFYMTKIDARKEQELFLSESRNIHFNRHPRFREDKPMTRSGLLLSGCNHALNHEPTPENSEDGILTAQRIASLDLRGLNLVVLSACETALGDISSGEGVFGLQRGFKKAGANTIIMSLWKVSDKATESLMTYFYQNYLNGLSKFEAFAAAREKLKNESPRRQNKPDWAAFIMLDGIN